MYWINNNLSQYHTTQMSFQNCIGGGSWG